MSAPDHVTTLSVRGEAKRTVEPDQATLYCAIAATLDTKSEAVAAVKRGLADMAAGLANLGGEMLTRETSRSSLTWSVQSIETHPEHGPNRMTGEYGLTGRHSASANVLIAVRDFELLANVESVLAVKELLDVHSVQWSVDHDNAAWALVRADAIQAALLKGRDYATALGGAVTSVDHVADAGLLGGDVPAPMARAMALEMSVAADATGSGSSLDPVPQVVSAVIEARLSATIGQQA